MKVVLFILLLVAGYYLYNHYEKLKKEKEAEEAEIELVDDSSSTSKKTTAVDPREGLIKKDLVEEKKVLTELFKKKTDLMISSLKLKNQINELQQKLDTIKSQIKDAQMAHYNKVNHNSSLKSETYSSNINEVRNQVAALNRDYENQINAYKRADEELLRKKEYYTRNMNKVSPEKAAQYRRDMADDQVRLAKVKAEAQREANRLRAQITSTRAQYDNLLDASQSDSKLPTSEAFKKEFNALPHVVKMVTDYKSTLNIKKPLDEKLTKLETDINVLEKQMEEHFAKHEVLREQFKDNMSAIEEAAYN